MGNLGQAGCYYLLGPITSTATSIWKTLTRKLKARIYHIQSITPAFIGYMASLVSVAILLSINMSMTQINRFIFPSACRSPSVMD